MKTLIYVCEDYNTLIYIVKKCLENNISFEFMNDMELYFTIYDNLDFETKKSILGSEIINYNNQV